MTWIIVTKKLPAQPSPPKMSMFWATAWPTSDAQAQLERERELFDGEDFEDYVANSDVFYDENGFGRDPIGSKAMKIHYKGHDIRVFSHEFSVLKHENMRLYIFGEDGIANSHSHELVPETEADKRMLAVALEGGLRDVYDAALIDGCNGEMAYYVTVGEDVSEMIEFPPIGWYRCRREYAVLYCYDDEMEE